MIELKINDNNFQINKILLRWDMERDLVRQLLVEKFEEQDFQSNNQTIEETDDFVKQVLGYSVTDFSINLADIASINQNHKQDQYLNFNGKINFFHLGYDDNHFLVNLKVHNGLNISLNNYAFNFDNDFETVLKSLKKMSSNFKKVDSGYYNFIDLKMSIANEKHMGGNGNKLSYFEFYK